MFFNRQRMTRECVCGGVRCWQWWQRWRLSAGGTINRSERDRENYVSVIVNHWAAGRRLKSKKRHAGAQSNFTSPRSLTLHLVAI